MSADTQPTKFCTNCKHFGGMTKCWHRNAQETSPVNGRAYRMDVGIARRDHCKGEWYEDIPEPPKRAIVPEPFEYEEVVLRAKRMRPSIFQRIKRWFG